MEWGRIIASSLKGLMMATEIILIIFGALLILELLKKKDLLIHIKAFAENLSMDRRIHIILVAWGLMYFMEGVSGFGTPAMIAVPILMTLGIRTITAIILALIGNSIAVSFGAIGLPVIFGVLQNLGVSDTNLSTLQNLPIYVTSLNIIGSIIVPMILLTAYTILEKKPLWHAIEAFPLAMVTGIATACTSILTAIFIGPELPSVIGGMVAMIVVYILSKKKLLTPKIEKQELLSDTKLTYKQKNL